jgi:hypothetical protein
MECDLRTRHIHPHWRTRTSSSPTFSQPHVYFGCLPEEIQSFQTSHNPTHSRAPCVPTRKSAPRWHTQPAVEATLSTVEEVEEALLLADQLRVLPVPQVRRGRRVRATPQGPEHYELLVDTREEEASIHVRQLDVGQRQSG